MIPAAYREPIWLKVVAAILLLGVVGAVVAIAHAAQLF